MHFYLNIFTRSRCFVHGLLLVKFVKCEVEVLKEDRESIGESEDGRESHRAMSLRAGLSALNTLNQRFCLRALYLSFSRSLSFAGGCL